MMIILPNFCKIDTVAICGSKQIKKLLESIKHAEVVLLENLIGGCYHFQQTDLWVQISYSK
jgi:hypothetical protein